MGSAMILAHKWQCVRGRRNAGLRSRSVGLGTSWVILLPTGVTARLSAAVRFHYLKTLSAAPCKSHDICKCCGGVRGSPPFSVPLTHTREPSSLSLGNWSFAGFLAIFASSWIFFILDADVRVGVAVAPRDVPQC